VKSHERERDSGGWSSDDVKLEEKERGKEEGWAGGALFIATLES